MKISRIIYFFIFIPLYLFSIKEKNITIDLEHIVKMEPFYDTKDRGINDFELFYKLNKDGYFTAELKTLFGLTIYSKELPNYKKGNHLLSINIGDKKIKKGIYSFSIKSNKNKVSINRLIYIP